MKWQLLLAVSSHSASHPSMAAPQKGPVESVDIESRLASLEPIYVGYTRFIESDDGRKVEVRTLAVRPPLFHIRGLLSTTESKALIDEARIRQMDMRASTMGGETVDENTQSITKRQNKRSFSKFRAMFKHFDKDHSGSLNKMELAQLLRNQYDLPNHDHDLFMKWGGNNLMSLAIREPQLYSLNLLEYRQWIMTNYPHMMERHSDQVWLRYNSSHTKSLLHRAEKITGLPQAVVAGESAMQVLHYGKLGHYSCHYDSPPSQIPNGQVVRLGTLAVFLNDPEAGGEIAFPGADKEGSETWNASQSVERWGNIKSECQATDQCTSMGGVVVSPRQGDAVLWYNMNVTHWSANNRGEFHYHSTGNTYDSFQWNSLHCGAEVSKGEKWMANVWFRAHVTTESSTVEVPTTAEVPSVIQV